MKDGTRKAINTPSSSPVLQHVGQHVATLRWYPGLLSNSQSQSCRMDLEERTLSGTPRTFERIVMESWTNTSGFWGYHCPKQDQRHIWPALSAAIRGANNGTSDAQTFDSQVMLRPLTHRSNQFEPLSQYRIAQLQALLFQSARIGIVVRSTPTRPCAAPHGKEKCSADDAPEMGSEISLHQIDSVRPHTANFIILSLYMYCQLKSSNGLNTFAPVYALGLAFKLAQQPACLHHRNWPFKPFEGLKQRVTCWQVTLPSQYSMNRTIICFE